MSDPKKKHAGELILTYDFMAPKEHVFNAFGSEEALNAWWGPVEMKNTVISLDFREGGIFHYKMENKGHCSYARLVYGQIQPYDLLEFTISFTDENAQIIPAPFDFPLPDEIFYTIVFTETNGKTTISLTGQPLHASEAQYNSFQSIRPDMRRGFGANFDLLNRYLKY
jgi:uncharacterized protein YndB with AHSA1/START domain